MSNLILGVDISSYQPSIDWQALKAGGCQFVYCKASDGTSQGRAASKRTLYYQAARKGAQSVAMPFGAYSYYHPLDDSSAQFAAFKAAIGSADAPDLPHMLDYEEQNSTVDADTRTLRVSRILQAMQDDNGKVPWLYTYPDFWKNYPAYTDAQSRLWLASYGSDVPSGFTIPTRPVPAPLDGFSELLMWQWGEYVTAPGIAGGHNTDADAFIGTLEELTAQV